MVGEQSFESRFCATVATPKGESKVYVRATSSSDVKRLLTKEAGYTVLSVVDMGMPVPLPLLSIREFFAGVRP